MNPYAIQYFDGRPMHYRLDDNHQPVPCSLVEWGQMLENDDDARRVARSEVGECVVSTVFLGIDHSWTGPPILFETMVFGPPTDKLNMLGLPETSPSPLGEDAMDRYSTWSEALIGHKRFVDRLRSALSKIDKLKPALTGETLTTIGDDECPDATSK